MATMEQKLSVGSKSSLTSIASGSESKYVLIDNCETTTNVSGVALKVRKPYTISKQREKWTVEEHRKFIEALKLYGRAWRQIEEYIGTKTAVQIRSHAQKFFSKVMRKGTCSEGAFTEPIVIPPPRPKRKPLHPYPRKLVETPSKTRQRPTLAENGASTNMKTSERNVNSPILVLSPEASQISSSLVKAQGSGCVSRTSSGSNLSQVDEKNTLIKYNSTRGKENGENLSLTLNLSGPLLDDSTSRSADKIYMDTEDIKDEDNYSESQIKFLGKSGQLKSIMLFGHTVAVANQSEHSDGMNNEVMYPAMGNQVTELASKISNQLVSDCILMRKRPSEKEATKGFSCTGSNSTSYNDMKNAETNLDSVDSKSEYSQQANINPNPYKKGFYPYKRCVSDSEAMYTVDDRESQRIRVFS